LDSDSGLLYYGARFYDPVLSHFLSADTIAPDSGNPQSRQRYSYAQNNPLRYIDPTGHKPCPDEECKETESEKKADELYQYGIEVEDPNSWLPEDLQFVIDAIIAMMNAPAKHGGTAWSIAQFKKAMGIDTQGMIKLALVDSTSDPNGPFSGHTELDGSRIEIDINQIRNFRSTHRGEKVDYLSVTMVHELAHVWDYRSGMSPGSGYGRLAGGMQDEVNRNPRKPAGNPSYYASNPDGGNPKAEMWAEYNDPQNLDHGTASAKVEVSDDPDPQNLQRQLQSRSRPRNPARAALD
jgi:RHS repeat-associated protein